jgi:hypothetical protein
LKSQFGVIGVTREGALGKALSYISGNDSIAHMVSLQAQGVSPGSTNGYANAQISSQGLHTCPRYYKQAANTDNVKPDISGPNAVWWFNGETPNGSAYPTSITLTSSGGSSTTWSVTQTDAKVNLSTSSGSYVAVTPTGSPIHEA